MSRILARAASCQAEPAYPSRIEEDGTCGGSTPGVWLCWNQLDPSTWDLSDWVWDVMEVKITGTPGVSVNFSLDDLHVGIL